MKNKIIYKWYTHQKYNGSVYYAFEYFAYLSQNDTDLEFLLINIDSQDLKDLLRSFSNKYQNIEHLFTNIKSVKTTSLYNIEMDKALILDLRTYHAIYTFYGEYEYQNYNVKCKLKLNFNIMKNIDITGNKTFISSRLPDQVDIKKYINQYNIKNPISKRLDKSIDIFKECDTILYVHQLLDTNNRIIPEAFHYKTRLIIVNETSIIDSTIIRYNDILKNGLSEYTIDDSDKLVIAMREDV